jgi:predicted transposase YdaD
MVFFGAKINISAGCAKIKKEKVDLEDVLIRYADGIAEGCSERSKEIVKQMKAMGLTAEQIAQATGLTLYEI